MRGVSSKEAQEGTTEHSVLLWLVVHLESRGEPSRIDESGEDEGGQL